MSVQADVVSPLPFSPRAHIALAVRDVDRSTAFYRALFNEAPTKERLGYARFEPVSPAVHLSLNEAEVGALPHPYHFGIHVEDGAAVTEFAERWEAAGGAAHIQTRTACCYAESTKAWVEDPDGHRWEIFARLSDDSEHFADTPLDEAAPAGCCPDAAKNVGAGDACCAPTVKASGCCDASSLQPGA